MLEVDAQVPAPEDWAPTSSPSLQGAPLELDLRLESVVEGVLVSGDGDGPAVGQCVRCLEPSSDAVDGRRAGAVRLPGPAAPRRRGRGRVRRARGRPDRPRARAPRRGGACTAVPTGVPGRLSGSVLRVRSAPGGRPGHQHDEVDPRWAALQSLPQTLPASRPNEKRTDVAVPKRKTSRSNTRSRRANWKTTAATLSAVPAVQRSPSSRTSRARPAAPTPAGTTPRPSAPSTRLRPDA